MIQSIVSVKEKTSHGTVQIAESNEENFLNGEVEKGIGLGNLIIIERNKSRKVLIAMQNY